MTPEKGRPPPGGEEARVVAYQPRGVGLIHTQRMPGDTHYTHESAARHKSETGTDINRDGRFAVTDTWLEMPI